MMDITCDACSKKYRIDETRMKSETARVRCKACGHMLHVAKPGWSRWPNHFRRGRTAGNTRGHL